MFLPLSSVLNNPYKRIYFIWGVVMLLGFSIPHYYQWFALSIIGLGAQIYKQRLRLWQAKALLILWGVVIAIAFTINYLILNGLAFAEYYPPHWAVWWLGIISFPQMLTGIILKKSYQIALGAIWLLLTFAFWNFPFGIQGTFFIVAIVTGLPYLFVAFSRRTL